MPTPKKSYCFTLNNYTDGELELLRVVCSEEASYAVIGREVGETGTPHLQGYIRFKKAYRFSTIKDRYLPRCHIEVAAGDADSNFRYCSKDGDFTEFGERPTSGKSASRADLARSFVSYMDDGRSGMVRFAHENPGTWYFSGATMLRNYYALQPAVDRSDVSVTWIFGDPGVGKSRKAHETLPQAYVKDPRTKWWNGYALEKDVIIDDFGPGGIDINHLLRWFDRYKCLVESKGGMIPLYAVNFIVTSNFHPEKVFSFAGDPNVQLPALMRRMIIKEMV
ncbi:replication associated protein [Anthevirus rigelis]|uniref:ATP-dependent helicase Rep n=1 Tax=Lake Sarah-associated circular virus-36 TaxID=1685764 RepID=A0A140AQP4_9VIRU|nr:replication associated protein [Lake Sarah-associated circular virus-36]